MHLRQDERLGSLIYTPPIPLDQLEQLHVSFEIETGEASLGWSICIGQLPASPFGAAGSGRGGLCIALQPSGSTVEVLYDALSIYQTETPLRAAPAASLRVQLTLSGATLSLWLDGEPAFLGSRLAR